MIRKNVTWGGGGWGVFKPSKYWSKLVKKCRLSNENKGGKEEPQILHVLIKNVANNVYFKGMVLNFR